MTESLREKRTRFTRYVPRLIDKAFELGYFAAGNEWLRTVAQAQANANSGAGIAHSVHLDGLAIDLNLYRADGTYIVDGTGHTELGAYWKTLQPDFCWGGDFSKRDFNHYSLTPDGIHK